MKKLGNEEEVLWRLSLRRIFWAERNGRSFCYAAKIVLNVVFVACDTRRFFFVFVEEELILPEKAKKY